MRERERNKQRERERERADRLANGCLAFLYDCANLQAKGTN